MPTDAYGPEDKEGDSPDSEDVKARLGGRLDEYSPSPIPGEESASEDESSFIRPASGQKISSSAQVERRTTPDDLPRISGSGMPSGLEAPENPLLEAYGGLERAEEKHDPLFQWLSNKLDSPPSTLGTPDETPLALDLPHDVADAAIPGQITYAEEDYSKSMILSIGQQVKVGRGLDTDIWLDDPAIDLAQAQITWRGRSWVVSNLGITCATILVSADGDGRAISGEVEIEGGQLRMGDAILTLSPAKAE